MADLVAVLISNLFESASFIVLIENFSGRSAPLLAAESFDQAASVVCFRCDPLHAFGVAGASREKASVKSVLRGLQGVPPWANGFFDASLD